MPLSAASFLNSGSWTCPAGVKNVMIIAAGGGGGGGAGSSNWGGGGGGGAAIQQSDYVHVTAGSVYTITIGAGGRGGIYDGYIIPSAYGLDGYSTTMKNSSGTMKFLALGGGGAGTETQDYSLSPMFGGTPFAKSNGFDTYMKSLLTFGGETFFTFPGSGGAGSSIIDGVGILPSVSGMMNFIGGYAGGFGSGPDNGDTGCPGGGGGAGPKGIGGSGGPGNLVFDGVTYTNVPGFPAGANTAAGGGGGGSDGSTLIGGNGGNGGSGYLYIIY